MKENRPIDQKDAQTQWEPMGSRRTRGVLTRSIARPRVWQAIATDLRGTRAAGRAFTLVEMMTATALATVLMIGVLSVIGTMKPTRPNRNDPTPHHEDIVHLIRWDLLNARTIQFDGNTLKLEGYGSLDPARFGWKRYALLPPSHQPITIEYRLWKERDLSWLVRRQIHPMDRSNRNAWTEVVACDIESFGLQPDSVANLQPLGANDPFVATEPVPDRVRLVMRSTNGLGQEINELIVLR